MEARKALTANLYDGVKLKYVANQTGLKRFTLRSKAYRQKEFCADSTMLNSSYKANAKKDRSIPAEKAANLAHAKNMMSMKSGAQHPVWLLPIPLEAAYLAYRRDFGEIVQNMIELCPAVFSRDIPTATAGSIQDDDTIPMHNISLVLRQGGTVPVEPWAKHMHRIRKWTDERLAAGLGTIINPRCIAFHGQRMTFIDVELSDDDVNPMDETVPSGDPTTAPSPSGDSTAEPAPTMSNNKLSKKTGRFDQLDSLRLWEKQLKESKEHRNMLCPRDYATWRKWLHYDPDFNWRSVTQPYNCDVCDKAHLTRTDHRNLWKKHVALELNMQTHTSEYLEVNGKLNKAADKVDDLERHMRQYANQRPFIRKLEDALPWKTDKEWHILVFEDFVAQYNFRKQKVANLVFTVKWRDEKGRLQYKYIDNFCSDESQSPDATYVITCWQAHLRYNELMMKLSRVVDKAGTEASAINIQLKELNEFYGYWTEFKGVTHINRTGDNGGHLLNKFLAWWESSVFETYGIYWTTHTLCKRHGYNLCDSHGAVIKKHINSFAKADHRPETAQDFANIINNCLNDYEGQALAFTYNARTRAYPILKLDRKRKDAFYKQVKKRAFTHTHTHTHACARAHMRAVRVCAVGLLTTAHARARACVWA
jgi:hypothetical protein